MTHFPGKVGTSNVAALPRGFRNSRGPDKGAMEFLGIDFSGNARSWRASRTTSNLWICRVRRDFELRPLVTELVPVQYLAGDGPPFQRLADLLAERQFSAAAIDAPFSLPSRHVPNEGWLKLLQLIDALPIDSATPFPNAQSLIELAQTISELESRKPLRRTEKLWSDRRINVRSTLWWKPRGGAPFAAACMKLLAMAGLPPCWPWSTRTKGLVVEAFPAAQLWSWKLPQQKYDGRDGIEVRQVIIRGLESRVDFGRFRKAAEQSADALDAVIASFAAIAAFRGEAIEPEGDVMTVAREGWIAVHP
jgi:predicted nuclease with RNAse H fold